MFRIWASSIADADLADWVTVGVYMFAALLSARAAGHAWLRRETRDNIFWKMTATLLVILGIKELFDFQVPLSLAARSYAITEGWYAERREIQYWFIVGLTVGTALAVAALLWLMRRTNASVRLAIFGLAFIGFYIVLRAVSFHHLDEILGSGFPVFNWGFIQELIGLFIVISAAILYARIGQRPVKMRRRDGRG